MSQNDNPIKLAKLMQLEMSRHEFLRYSGAVILGVIGITGLIKTLHESTPAARRVVASGYGRGAYGR